MQLSPVVIPVAFSTSRTLAAGWRMAQSADNKPNLAPGVHWIATLTGEWNLNTGKLENAKLTPGELEVRE